MSEDRGFGGGDQGSTMVLDPPATGRTPRQVTETLPVSSHAALSLGGSLLDELELPVEVRLGHRVWPLERVLGLRVGDAIPVGPETEDAVTLYVQGRPYATGDLVVVDGRFAFRVRELIKPGGDQ